MQVESSRESRSIVLNLEDRPNQEFGIESRIRCSYRLRIREYGDGKLYPIEATAQLMLVYAVE